MIRGVNLDKDDLSRRVIKRAEHYGRYTLETIVKTAIRPFTLLSNKRRCSPPRATENTFIEDIISNSVAWTIIPMEIVTAVSYHPFGAALVLSNSFFFMYRLKDKNVGLRGIGQYVRKIPGRIMSRVCRLPESLRRFVRRMPRNFAIYLCTYALVSSLAYSHFKLSSRMEQFHKEKVDVIVREFTLERNNKIYHLYLLGEAHVYNYSSSSYVQRLVREVRPDRLLSEGMDIRDKPKVGGFRGYTEKMIGVSYKIIAAGSGRFYPDVVHFCLEEGIPIIPLEVVDEQTKGRKGLSDGTYVLLGITSTASVLYAPAFYFGYLPMRYFGIPDLERITSVILRGAIYKRNELMVKEAVSEMDRQGELTYLKRVGKGHVDGVVLELHKYGKLQERPFILP